MSRNDYVNKIMSSKVKKQLYNTNNNIFNVSGNIKIKPGDSPSKVVYWAPNPPDYNTSFNGSGMPFPNPVVAYENTPNIGSVPLDGNSYSFDILFPNSYYSELGTVYNEPRVHIKLCSDDDTVYDIHTIVLKNPIPYRSLAPGVPELTIPRTAGNSPDKSNIQLQCGNYGLCGNNSVPEGELVDQNRVPFFYTNFYQQQPNKLRSQQDILWDSRFPSSMKWWPNFWGNKPPQ